MRPSSELVVLGLLMVLCGCGGGKDVAPGSGGTSGGAGQTGGSGGVSSGGNAGGDPDGGGVQTGGSGGASSGGNAGGDPDAGAGGGGGGQQGVFCGGLGRCELDEVCCNGDCWLAPYICLGGPQKPCTNTRVCPAELQCDYRPHSCLQTRSQGTCISRPTTCDSSDTPVCGCDGITYANDCERKAAGAQPDHEGPC